MAKDDAGGSGANGLGGLGKFCSFSARNSPRTNRAM